MPRAMNHLVPGTIAMTIVVVASNILVQHPLGNWLTWGALTYPFAFLVTDVMNRIFGKNAARRVVLIGFAAGVLCSLVGTRLLNDAGIPYVTVRIAFGSGGAFLVAQLIDITIFDRLRNRQWWFAPLLSSLVGSLTDTALFFTIAFAATLPVLAPDHNTVWAGELLPLLGFGPTEPVWVSLGVADWMVKTACALCALVPFRLIVQKLAPPPTSSLPQG